MGSEAGLYKTIRKNMKGRWEVQRIENLTEPGVPDIYYTINETKSGWIELKYISTWPKNIVRLNHYTKFQRAWIRRHGRRGKNIFLLLQVNKEYLLFNWEAAVKYVGLTVKNDLIKHANKYWINRINWDEFISEL